MLCDNCGRKEANVRYSENINGKTRALNLCEECSKRLGITKMDFNMPIDFSSFFGEFMEDFATPKLMPLFNEVKELKCQKCGYTFEDIVNTGKLGCEDCYNVFEDKIDPIIKKIQGANRHVGRIGKVINESNSINNNTNGKNTQNFDKQNEVNNTNSKEIDIERLQRELKDAIKEERYEDAAKIRDELKKFQ